MRAFDHGHRFSCLIENNYFKNVKNPHEFSYPENTALGACITAKGNVYEEIAGTKDTGQKNSKKITLFEDAEYDYHCHAASDVPDVVTQYGGKQSRNAATQEKAYIY